jgi:hypothetical protein
MVTRKCFWRDDMGIFDAFKKVDINAEIENMKGVEGDGLQ